MKTKTLIQKQTQHSASIFFQFLLIYFAAIVIFGIFRLNLILELVDSSIVKTARVSSYISLVTSAIFSIFMVYLLIGGSYFFKHIIKSKIDNYKIINALKKVVITFVFFEIIKFLFTFFMLPNELYYFNLQLDIIEQLMNTDWYFYDSISKYLMIIFSAFIFVVELQEKVNKSEKRNVIFLSLFLFSCLLAVHVL